MLRTTFSSVGYVCVPEIIIGHIGIPMRRWWMHISRRWRHVPWRKLLLIMTISPWRPWRPWRRPTIASTEFGRPRSACIVRGWCPSVSWRACSWRVTPLPMARWRVSSTCWRSRSPNWWTWPRFWASNWTWPGPRSWPWCLWPWPRVWPYPGARAWPRPHSGGSWWPSSWWPWPWSGVWPWSWPDPFPGTTTPRSWPWALSAWSWPWPWPWSGPRIWPRNWKARVLQKLNPVGDNDYCKLVSKY